MAHGWAYCRSVDREARGWRLLNSRQTPRARDVTGKLMNNLPPLAAKGPRGRDARGANANFQRADRGIAFGGGIFDAGIGAEPRPRRAVADRQPDVHRRGRYPGNADRWNDHR